jgi:hypothetical protein
MANNEYRNAFHRALAEVRAECEHETPDLCDARNCECARPLYARSLQAEIVDTFDPKKTSLLTIFDQSNEREFGQLSSLDLKNALRRYKRKIKEAGIEELKGVGALDLQLLCFPENPNKVPVWRPHIHAYVMSDETSSSITEKLREQFTDGPNNPRPVLTKPVNRWPPNIGYLFKSHLDVPLRYLLNEKLARSRMCAKGKHADEVRNFMEEWKLEDWTLYLGIRSYGTSLKVL